MKPTNLPAAPASIIQWVEDGMISDFPEKEVEQAIDFCKGDVRHRIIAVSAISLLCLPFCTKQEISVVDQKLISIANNESVT